MPGEIFPIKKILSPTDLSEPSYTGIAAASAIAKNQSAELIIIHVVTPLFRGGAVDSPTNFNVKEYYDEMRDIAEQNLEKHLQEQISKGVTARTIITFGNAVDEIVKTAEEEGVDLIVIATHGWTGWRRFVFGSVTEKVVRLSYHPVLTIPEPRSNE